jgi:VanZ family protein
VVGRAGAGAGAYLIVVLACATLSFGIETMQHFFLPWRYSTWIDIVSNTVGGLAGTGVARLMAVPVSAGVRAGEVNDGRLLRAEDPPPTT